MRLTAHFVRFALLLAAPWWLVAGIGRAERAPLATDSPFLSGPETARPGAAAAANAGPLQLAGITVIGQETLVTVVEGDKKRQRTIAVGAKGGDLEVLNCDAEKGIAVLKIGNETQTLTLRKPSAKTGPQPTPAIAAGSNTPPAIPNVGPAGGVLPPVKPLVTKEEQEREARMLVSDLLEIGMRQRKAYEEEQRKAAAAQGKK